MAQTKVNNARIIAAETIAAIHPLEDSVLAC
jgi:hypothetical protein